MLEVREGKGKAENGCRCFNHEVLGKLDSADCVYTLKIKLMGVATMIHVVLRPCHAKFESSNIFFFFAL